MYKSMRFKVHRRKGVEFNAPSLTQSQFQRDCDINVMIRRALTGDISAIVNGKMIDASDAPESFHDSLNIMAKADTAWEEMPDSVRRTYGNKEAFILAFDNEVKRIAELSRNPDKIASPEKGEPSKGESEPSTT